ncbi:glycosyltransferase family 2 protein [Nonomuraea maritima]|uniref:glycosyltransferase family 2 protein n=1 Tax=Nonomuraea maritima TaxID=683260 RepID=UPI00372122A1
MSRPFVTAVVVAHDGARWLGETLRALLSQSRRPDRVSGVDNGSKDGSADLLAQTLGAGNVISLPRTTGFGEAVAEALADLPPAGREEWIWLIHDDCAPDRRALEALLAAAEDDPKAAVLGPKLRDWIDRRRLLEMGVTVGRTGRRDTGLEPGEFDQGQYGGTRDVLSVSTAGMLIRRDVWEKAGGLDPYLPLFRDDLDLCWRVRNAGHKVLSVTSAVAWHAEASARRRRPVAVSADHPRRLDRRNAIFVVLANLPLGAMLWALLRNVVSALVRTVLFVVSKQPANALDEVLAMGSILAHPGRLRQARRARRQGRKRGYVVIKHLMTSRWTTFRRFTDMVQGFLSGEGPLDPQGRHQHAATDDENELVPPPDTGAVKRFVGRPGVVLMFALSLVALVAERSLLGGERLGGGALVPVAGGATDLWTFYTEGFHDVGLGSTAPAPPYVAVLAVLSTLAFGKPWVAVSVLLLGSVPLAGATAYLATRHLVPAVSARAWAAGTYALLPVATGAISAGRLGTAVVFVLIPVYAWLIAMLLSGEPRRARRSAWGLGLLLTVGTAFVPLVYPLVAVLGIASALAVRSLTTRSLFTAQATAAPDLHTAGEPADFFNDRTPAAQEATADLFGSASSHPSAQSSASDGHGAAGENLFSAAAPGAVGQGRGAGVAAALGQRRAGGVAAATGQGRVGVAAAIGQGRARHGAAVLSGHEPAGPHGPGPVAAGSVLADQADFPQDAGEAARGRRGRRGRGAGHESTSSVPTGPELAAEGSDAERGRRGRRMAGRASERAAGRETTRAAGRSSERAAGRAGAGVAVRDAREGEVRGGVAASMGIALGVPLVLLMPWLATLVTDPARFLMEAGLNDPALADPSIAAESLLALSPGGPGLPPLWVTAGLMAVALAALLMRRQRVIVAFGWGVALYGILAAVLVSRFTVEGAPVWPGVPLAVAGAGLVVLVGLTAHRLSEIRAAGGTRRLAALAVAAVAFSTPLLAAGHWMVTGVRGPLTGDAPDVLPALAVSRSANGERTLVIKGSALTILHGRTPLVGEAELPVASEARAKVVAAAQGLVGGRGGDAATLARYGIAMVSVAPPVSPTLARTLDSQPSLHRLSLSEAGGLWGLAEQVTRVPAQPVSILHTPWLWAQGVLVVVIVILASPGRRPSEGVGQAASAGA